MSQKKILDISDTNQELKYIESEISIINHRFIGLSLDYRTYINQNVGESVIFKHRDNVSYRLRSSVFHLRMMFVHLHNSEKAIEQETLQNSGLAFAEIYKQQISSIFESFIYHTVSVFDYIGSLANFISGTKNGKPMKWTQIAKSVRDKNNKLSESKFAKEFDKIDREFVAKLYDYRSMLIHREIDFGGNTVTWNLMQGKVNTVFYAGSGVTRGFKPLKQLCSEHDLTLKYVAMWLIKEAVNNINRILFALKDEIESNYSGEEFMMYYQHPITKEKMPASTPYWNIKINK